MPQDYRRNPLNGLCIVVLVTFCVGSIYEFAKREPRVSAFATVVVQVGSAFFEKPPTPEQVAINEKAVDPLLKDDAEVASAEERNLETGEAEQYLPVIVAEAPEMQFQRVTVMPHLNFTQALAMYTPDNNTRVKVVSESVQVLEEKASAKVASLPPLIVDAPKERPKKVQVSVQWSATLDHRKGMIRGYLQKHCPNLIPLESLQSQATLQQMDVKIAAAKSWGVVLGGILAELRTHSFIVPKLCPTEFVAYLFPEKK